MSPIARGSSPGCRRRRASSCSSPSRSRPAGPTTEGRPLRAPVVILPDVADSAGLVAWLPQAKGKFVLVSFAQPTCRPDDSWEKWATQTTADTMKARRTAAQQAWLQRLQRTGYWGTGVAAAAGLLPPRGGRRCRHHRQPLVTGLGRAED